MSNIFWLVSFSRFSLYLNDEGLLDCQTVPFRPISCLIAIGILDAVRPSPVHAAWQHLAIGPPGPFLLRIARLSSRDSLLTFYYGLA